MRYNHDSSSHEGINFSFNGSIGARSLGGRGDKEKNEGAGGEGPAPAVPSVGSSGSVGSVGGATAQGGTVGGSS